MHLHTRLLRLLSGAAIAGIAFAGLTACTSGANEDPLNEFSTSTATPTALPPATTETPGPSPTPYPSPAALTPYIAIGDSYAAGVGGGGEKGKCRRGPNAYGVQLSAMSGIPLQRNAACGGATTADVQRNQLGALSTVTRLITLSVGGDDLDTSSLAASCGSTATTECRTKFGRSLSLMKVLPDRLAATYAAVASAAPDARIIVTGYPILFTAPASNSPTFPAIAVADSAAYTLNETIQKAVAKAKKAGMTISYVGVDFRKHRIGADDSWMNSSGVDAFHPTAAGYAEYARAVLAELNTATDQ